MSDFTRGRGGGLGRFRQFWLLAKFFFRTTPKLKYLSVFLSVRLSVCRPVFLSFWHPVDTLNNFCFDMKAEKLKFFFAPCHHPPWTWGLIGNIGIQLKRHMKFVYETFISLGTHVINHLIKKRHVQFDHVDIFIVTPRHFGGGEKKWKAQLWIWAMGGCSSWPLYHNYLIWQIDCQPPKMYHQWVLKWLLTFTACEKYFEHSFQINSFSPEWVLMWIFRLPAI